MSACLARCSDQLSCARHGMISTLQADAGHMQSFDPNWSRTTALPKRRRRSRARREVSFPGPIEEDCEHSVAIIAAKRRAQPRAQPHSPLLRSIPRRRRPSSAHQWRKRPPSSWRRSPPNRRTVESRIEKYKAFLAATVSSPAAGSACAHCGPRHRGGRRAGGGAAGTAGDGRRPAVAHARGAQGRRHVRARAHRVAV